MGDKKGPTNKRPSIRHTRRRRRSFAISIVTMGDLREGEEKEGQRESRGPRGKGGRERESREVIDDEFTTCNQFTPGSKMFLLEWV